VIFIVMEEHIKNSETISEAIKSIYGFDNGTTRRKFRKAVKENNYDISNLRSRKLKHKIVIKECPVCNNEFETQVGTKNEKTTCSHSCSNTYFRSGKNNPNWKLISDNKDRFYRDICFIHHDKRCVVCGEDKIVSVHHYDENHSNNEPSNLIPLCPTHHHYIHSKWKDEVIDIVTEYRNVFIKMSYFEK